MSLSFRRSRMKANRTKKFFETEDLLRGIMRVARLVAGQQKMDRTTENRIRTGRGHKLKKYRAATR